MTRSGVKRGLVAPTIAALALTGLPSLTTAADAAPATPTLSVAAGSGAVAAVDDPPPAQVAVSDETPLIDGWATPGRPVTFTLTLTDGSGAARPGETITLRTDRGFFTQTAESAGDLVVVHGASYGEWESLGNELHVTTDENGRARATLAIERDAGFDDDGQVDSTITVTLGDGGTVPAYQVTAPSTIGWSTLEEPLNPGSLTVATARGGQESRILPAARIDQVVLFDVFARDQFGNLVEDEVEVVDDGEKSDFRYAGRSNFAGKPAVAAYSVHPDLDQQLTATWTTDASSWSGDGTRVKAPTTLPPSLSRDVHWYTVDFANAAYRWISWPAGGTVPVGTAVLQSVDVRDQKGQPIEGLTVVFDRSGPDTQRGFFVDALGTGASGRSLTYKWVGTVAGVARVQALVYDRWDRRSSLGVEPLEGPTGRQVAKVVFPATTFERLTIAAGVALGNNPRGDDVAFVNAPATARGAAVALYRFDATGRRVLAGRKLANSAGDVRFVVADADKRAYTRYQAVVSRTPRTHGDWTPIRRVR